MHNTRYCSFIKKLSDHYISLGRVGKGNFTPSTVRDSLPSYRSSNSMRVINYPSYRGSSISVLS